MICGWVVGSVLLPYWYQKQVSMYALRDEEIMGKWKIISLQKCCTISSQTTKRNSLVLGCIHLDYHFPVWTSPALL